MYRYPNFPPRPFRATTPTHPTHPVAEACAKMTTFPKPTFFEIECPPSTGPGVECLSNLSSLPAPSDPTLQVPPHCLSSTYDGPPRPTILRKCVLPFSDRPLQDGLRINRYPDFARPPTPPTHPTTHPVAKESAKITTFPNRRSFENCPSLTWNPGVDVFQI
jgi:hypothetical protein